VESTGKECDRWKAREKNVTGEEAREKNVTGGKYGKRM